MRSLRGALLVTVATASVPALAQRLDHAGQIGARLAVAGEYLTVIGTTSDPAGSYSLFAGGLEAGPTIWIDDEGDEVSLRARWLRGLTGSGSPEIPAHNTLSFLAGFRKYAGRDEWKTFLDGDLVVSPVSAWLGGLHVAVGVEWDPTRTLGAYASFGVIAEAGASFRFRFEATAGMQVRFDVASP